MTDEMTAAADKSSSKRRRTLIFLSAAIALIVLLPALPAALFFMLFANWQEIPPTQMLLTDFSTVHKLMRKVTRNFSDRKKIPEKAVLKLSPRQVGSLFRLAGNVEYKRLPFPVRYFRPACSEDGLFSLVYPVRPFEKGWLKKKTLYLYVTFRISKKSLQEDIRCDILSVKLTHITLPSWGKERVQQIVDRELARNKPGKGVIESISFKKGKWVIVYAPRKLLQTFNKGNALPLPF